MGLVDATDFSPEEQARLAEAPDGEGAEVPAQATGTDEVGVAEDGGAPGAGGDGATG